MKSILTLDGGYLEIFQRPVRVNRALPKWLIIDAQNPENKKKVVSGNSELNIITSLEGFQNMDSKDFNVYLGKKIVDDLVKKTSFKEADLAFGPALMDKPVEVKKGLAKMVHYFRMKLDKIDEKEEVYELDILKFFENIKLTCKKSISQYNTRIAPYILALKDASDMGQTALVDTITAQLFNAKYESILYAEGLHYKISEQQIVDFVKKTEEGVQLCYIENFIRPIPKEVLAKKKKADELLVFDNYCVMYYDKDTKSYKLTKKEEQRERERRADPILFGMIAGSHNLYYVTDWIDKYCDLTLDEFIKVSGLDKKKLKIEEKIAF